MLPIWLKIGEQICIVILQKSAENGASSYIPFESLVPGDFQWRSYVPVHTASWQYTIQLHWNDAKIIHVILVNY